MFRHSYNYASLSEASACYKTMTKDLRCMYSSVFNLLKVLLVFPVSSCESERSFSCLRRLKTWLRSTMTQERLNSAVMCHVHRLTLDTASIEYLSKTFITGSYQRINEFGIN